MRLGFPFHLGIALKLLVLLSVGVSSIALAHATVVFGTLQTDTVPLPGEPIRLSMILEDPTEVPVEDAWVLAELRPQGAQEAEPVSARFEESDPGVYWAEFTLPEAGEWQLLLRDQTFRQEEAEADLTFPVGTGDGEEIVFLFPPTATGQSNLMTWLVWLIALPLAAGLIVTVVVLRRGNSEDAEVDGAV